MAALDLLDFTCPRCGTAAAERFYGPCSTCRTALSALGGDATSADGAPGRFEPKMHVTPNHVATKE